MYSLYTGYRRRYLSLSCFIWILFILLITATLLFYFFSGTKLVTYQASNIKGYKDKPIIVDSGFVSSMDKLNQYAKENNLTLYVTSSFRKADRKVNGSIVTPAARSNHLVGHAVDINIESYGKWYDSRLMQKNNLKYLPANIQNFFNSVRRDKSLRWGGNFKIQDPVHIDDYFNKNYKKWQRKFDELQSSR